MSIDAENTIPKVNYVYNAFVKRVIDGDTFDAVVDTGFTISVNQRFRLKDIDTPETWRPKTEAEHRHGEKATKFTRDLIEGKNIVLTSVKAAVYSRYEAVVTLADGRDLATLLREAGLEKLDSYSDDSK